MTLRETRRILLDGTAIPETDRHGFPITGDTLLILMNAATAPVTFALPAPAESWRESLNAVDPQRPLSRSTDGASVTLAAFSAAVFLRSQARQP